MKVVVGSAREMPHSACPCCGKRFECASGIGYDGKPRAGSLSICVRCAELLIFDEGLYPRKLTSRELLEVQLSLDWPRIQKACAAVKQVWEGFARKAQ
jgi:hypothetical protein